jgi:hypothetical protein
MTAARKLPAAGGDVFSLDSLMARADCKEITSEELPFIAMTYGLSNMESFLPNPYVPDTGRMRTRWRHLGEETPVESA